MYLCWQNDNTVLGVATTEEIAQNLCSEYGDSYMYIEEDKAHRDYEETTELVKYNIDNKFLSYQECLDKGIKFTKPDKQYRNKKNGKIYTVTGNALNCTNAQDGQEMFMYKVDDCNLTFVRSKEEFYEKFEKLEGMLL